MSPKTAREEEGERMRCRAVSPRASMTRQSARYSSSVGGWSKKRFRRDLFLFAHPPGRRASISSPTFAGGIAAGLISASRAISEIRSGQKLEMVGCVRVSESSSYLWSPATRKRDCSQNQGTSRRSNTDRDCELQFVHSLWEREVNKIRARRHEEGEGK